MRTLKPLSLRRTCPTLFWMILCALWATSLGTRTAIAAPSLTADSNPVLIAEGSSEAPVKVTWNTGDATPAKLWLSVDGAADKEVSALETTGTYTRPIELGKSYEFKLYTKFKAKLLASLTVTAKSVKPTLPTKVVGRPRTGVSSPIDKANLLAFQSINGLNVTPHGTFADFTFTTRQPTVPIILASTKAPGPDRAFAKGDVSTSSWPIAGGKQTSHRVQLLNLEPNTTYHFIVSAFHQGKEVKKMGVFTTLRRFVQITFDRVHVNQDSDKMSAGDLSFEFYINGDNAPGGKVMRYPRAAYAYIDSGKTQGLQLMGPVDRATGKVTWETIGATLADAPDSIKLRVTGVDDDCPTIGACACFRMADEEESRNATDCEWVSGVETIDLPDGPDEDFARDFALQGKARNGGNSDLDFVVFGKMQVHYGDAPAPMMRRLPPPSQNAPGGTTRRNVPVAPVVKPPVGAPPRR